MKTMRKNLRAYIIEDEVAGYENLFHMLESYCPDVEVVGNAFTVQESLSQIEGLEPNIVFLDIELPRENGFQLFKYFPNRSFDVIFVTAYSDYAIKAFNYSAIHYILKPIDLEELQLAIQKVVDQSQRNDVSKQLEVWNRIRSNDLSRIVLPTLQGMHFVDIENIIWCEAKSNYTMVHVVDSDPIMVSKSLKIYEDMLNGKSFFRASRSSLINVNHIVHCSTHKRMEITLSDDSVVTISERRRAVFKEKVLNDFV